MNRLPAQHHVDPPPEDPRGASLGSVTGHTFCINKSFTEWFPGVNKKYLRIWAFEPPWGRRGCPCKACQAIPAMSGLEM
eukprot:4516379-Prymnesium_polylepis.1